MGLFAVHAVSAYAAGGAGLPWETPLATITESLTGPVAYGVTLGGVFGSGAALLFHGDMGDFGKKGCQIACAGGTVLFASQLLTSAFGATGAMI
jgi:type IV secretion system protein VirB2